MAFFEAADIFISFGGLMALRQVGFSVEKGEVFSIVGPNGAGKTTIFNCVNRFYDLDQGRFSFKERDITRVRPHEVPKLGISRTFQNVELCRSMTALQNLMVGQHVIMRSDVIRDGLRLPSARQSQSEAMQHANEILELLELMPYRDRVVSTLPFGLQKMVELGRALASRPLLLLLDEPATGEDSRETQILAELIRRIHTQFNVSILIVEHDMPFVMGLCQRLYVLDFGKKIAEGVPMEIRKNPAVIEAYLGDPDLTLSEA